MYNLKVIEHQETDVIRWVLNLVVPLMTLFGVLNLVVSGEIPLYNIVYAKKNL